VRPATDVRSEQVEANKTQIGELAGNRLAPTWLVGDGEDCVALFRKGLAERELPPDTQADLIFTCPPYYDREVYSSDPRDLSCAASYDDFRTKYARALSLLRRSRASLTLTRLISRYKRMLSNAVSVLRDGYCVAIVVANVRAKDGRMLDLTGHTKCILDQAGCLLHEDAVLLEPNGTAPQEASSAVRGGKLVSVHQNLIVCTKGDTPLNAERVQALSIHPGPIADAASSKRAASSAPSGGGKKPKAAPSPADESVDVPPSVEVLPPTCFTVPPHAVRRFAALSTNEKLQLFQRVIESTDGRGVLRRAIVHQLEKLRDAGHAVPRDYGRCVDVCRAWALLDSSVTLRREERGAPDAVRVCGCEQCSGVFHCFLETRAGERIDPTAEQLILYGAATGAAQDFRVEPTPQARTWTVKVGDGKEQRIAECGDLVTLKAAVRELEQLDEDAAGCVTDLSLITPIEQHGVRWAKRDDLLGVNGARGTKAAAVLSLAQEAKARGVGVGLVVAASRVSTMLSRVARVCEHVGVPCRLHVSHSKELGVEEADAQQHGATLVKHNINRFKRRCGDRCATSPAA
jgi:hypothetical protein